MSVEQLQQVVCMIYGLLAWQFWGSQLVSYTVVAFCEYIIRCWSLCSPWILVLWSFWKDREEWDAGGSQRVALSKLSGWHSSISKSSLACLGVRRQIGFWNQVPEHLNHSWQHLKLLHVECTFLSSPLLEFGVSLVLWTKSTSNLWLQQNLFFCLIRYVSKHYED